MSPSSLRTPLLCLSLLALAACGGKEKNQQQPPPPTVDVLTATPATAPLTKDLVGRLSPYRSADVRARVSGILLKRTYEEGSDVKQGQLLFQIDPAPLQAALASARANLAQAEATYTNAKVSAQRIRKLAPEGYVSRSDLDNALAAERSAAASVQQGRANVKTAEINLGYADVRSPIDGRSSQQQVTEGALVGQGEATLLTTVEQIDPLYVNFTLSASELDQMRRAQAKGRVELVGKNKASVKVALPDGTLFDQDGTLDFSDAAVNPATGSVNLRAKIPNPEHTLLPGQYVTVKANLGEQRNIYRIPQKGVLRDTQGAYVYVVGKDGKVVRKNVALETLEGSDWIINDGLSAGDKVVVSGVQKVKEGGPANPQPWSPGKDAQSANPPAQAGGNTAAAGKQ